MEAGRAEPVAPGVVRQRLVQPEPRWTDAGTTENLSQGQLRPSTLRGPGSKTPRARPPARTPTAGRERLCIPAFTYVVVSLQEHLTPLTRKLMHKFLHEYKFEVMFHSITEQS